MCTQAYIPKRGLFYEHDDRLESGEEEEGDEGEEGKPKQEKSGDKSESGKPATDGSAEKAGLKPKRVFRSDAAEKWGHDKFSEYDQAPKSSEELVSVYGYDIRNEDNAPRARRRRRYGRGPNKYTRNWEDEAAYQQKTTRPEGTGPGVKKKFENSKEAFPPLGGEGDTQSGTSSRRPPREDSERLPQQHQMQQRGGTRGRGQRDGYNDNSHQQERDFHGGHRDERGGHRGGRGRGIREPFRRGIGERIRSPGGGNRRPDEHDLENFEKLTVAGNKDRIGSGRVPSHDSEVGGEAKPKRYSSSRPNRGQAQSRGGGHTGNGRDNFYQQQEFSQDQPKQLQQQGRSGPNSSGKTDPIQFSGSQAFPNTRTCGPPPDAPFLNVTSASTITATGTTPYINPAGGMMNYGPPPPVPYAAVPVTVPIPLVGDNPLAMIAASHLNPVQTFVPNPVSTQDPVMLAAAAAAAQGQGYAEVRGGVTYFHPQASASVRGPAQVSKRPKAAIPIVDPSEVSDQGKGVQHQNGDAKPSEDAQLATAPANAEAATA